MIAQYTAKGAAQSRGVAQSILIFFCFNAVILIGAARMTLLLL